MIIIFAKTADASNFSAIMQKTTTKFILISLIIVPALFAGTLAGQSSELTWLSILPPLISIVLALVTRETLVALFAGIWIGVSLITGNLITGLTQALDTYLVGSLSNPDHSAIILFSLGFGGMIGVISANGGMKGMVALTVKFATNRRRGQLATAIMGVVIFFDDYANTLLVGNMMRPFTDSLKISREKLSYLVDSTAAPVSSLAVISTWSIFQMSLLEQPYAQFGVAESPYITFLRSIPFSFYCIFTLIFIFTNILMRREYGPMLQAEARAVSTGEVLRPGAKPMTDTSLIEGEELNSEASHWTNAILPILAVVVVTMIGLWVTGVSALGEGEPKTLRNIIGNSNSYASLMWGAYFASFLAIALSVFNKKLTLTESILSWTKGVKSMTMAAIVLVLAWGLGKVCHDLKTAEYLVHVSSGIITPAVFPTITFITAGAISFSTGTSWATMSILVPIIMPMAMQMMGGDPNAIVAGPMFTATFAAILSGSVLGDHCSPISDTTIMSSMASGSDHIDHVRTQLPYAMTAGLVAIFAGYLLTGAGLHWSISILLGGGLIWVILRFAGKKVSDAVPVTSD